MLLGPCPDGEPQRARGHRRCHAGIWHGRTRHRPRSCRRLSPGKRRITVGDDKGSMSRASCRTASATSLRKSPSMDIRPRPASGVRPPSINAPCAIPAMPSVITAANASRKCSAGSRQRAAWLRSKCAAWPRYRPSSSLLLSPTISCEYPSFWRRHEAPHDECDGQQVADHRDGALG